MLHGHEVSDDVRLQCVQALLAAGASPNASNGRAPLNYPAHRGDPAILNALLRAGADPNYADPLTGWTALHAAAITGKASCAIALLKAGANVEAIHGAHGNNSTPLLYAIVNCHVSTIPILLRAGARLEMNRIAALYRADLVPPYIAKVHAAGGWKKYEQVHLKQLVPTLSKVFPVLPVEVVSQIVCFWAHVGYY